MKSNRNTILAITVAVLGVGAYFATRESNAPRGVAGVKPGDVLLPGLDLEKAAVLRIVTTNQTVEIRKDGDAWKAASLQGFPANEEIVREQLITLSALNVGQVMPGGEKNPGDFGLGDAARKVEVLDAAGKVLGALSIGKPRMRAGASDNPFGGMPEGSFVRAGDGPVVLVDRDLGALAADAMRWINANLFSLPSTEITRIAVSTTNESSIVTLAGNGKYAMEGLAADEEVNTGRAGRLERALQYINVSGVMDAKTPADKTGLDKAALYVAETKEGLRYTVSIGGNAENGRYATFAFAYEAPPGPTEDDARKALAAMPAAAATNQVQSAATNDVAKVTAKLDELKKAHADKVKAANDKLATLKKNENWIFIVPAYTAEDMTPPRAELVQKKVQPAPPAADPNAPPTTTDAPGTKPGPVTVFSEPVVVTNIVPKVEAPAPTPEPAATNALEKVETPEPTPAPASTNEVKQVEAPRP
jgi:hypothetical protein